MKFLKSHLLEKVPMKIDTKKLETELTRLGLEVDSVKKFKNKADFVLDLDLTPNRGDCFSVLGIARELAAAQNKKIKQEIVDLKKTDLKPKTRVKLSAQGACPRYSFIEIHNFDNSKKIPNFILDRLEAGGINSINPVVDILNYVMLDFGQPMHAFDLNKIGKVISVRYAKDKEKVKLLDESTKVLNKNCLVISDENQALAFAGIMGGLNSSVTNETNSIFIESAFFAPDVIRGKARNFNIQTDSSQRFERGVDFNLQIQALKKVTNLIIKYLSGSYSVISTVEQKKHIPDQRKITLNLSNLRTKLGYEIKSNKIKKVLKSLDLKVESLKNNFLTVEVSSHRFDLKIEEDLIEEIARIEGYDNIPSIDLKTTNQQFRNSKYLQSLQLKKYLANQGYQEVINYSFINKQILDDLDITHETIKIKNPLNENLEVMRPSLMPSLLTNLKSNLNRGETFVKIFEEGKVFKLDSAKNETNIFAGLIFDHDKKKNWNNKVIFDFFDLKKIIIDMLGYLSATNIKFMRSKNVFLHPNISLDVVVKGKIIGSFGRVHPKINKNFGIKKTFFYFEFLTESLFFESDIKINESSKYPSIQRDLSFLIPGKIDFDKLYELAKKLGGSNLVNFKLFDLYQESEKNQDSSYAFNFTWQSKKKTLEDKEIDLIVSDIIKGFQEKFNAKLRS